VEKTGVSVTVRDAVHAHANHYIKESRPYFQDQQLTTYIDCPYLLKIARGMLVASLFGALVAVGGSIALPIFFFIACLLFFCIYCQHEWVNQKSLPVVLKQPVYKQWRANEFYEVTLTELDGVALQNHQSGIGVVEVSQGKIKFQAFNKTAIRRMSDAKGQSRLMLILFLMAAVYNCYFMAAYSKT